METMLGHASTATSGTDWTALVAALAGAAIGAGIGGWFTLRERLRAARSRLYNHLHDFHDGVNNRRQLVRQTQEPSGTGDLGELFRAFDRDAATASGFDSRAVRAIWPILNSIDAAAGKYARRTVPNEQAVDAARDLATAQLVHWDSLDEYLWHYRRWLEWKATKRWWSIYRNVRKGAIGPDETSKAPGRLQ